MQAVNDNMEDNSMMGLTTGLDFKEPVQRPSSTSTNGSLPQLPGISNLAAVNASNNNSPPMRYVAWCFWLMAGGAGLGCPGSVPKDLV
jgi:hypothetical protein